MKTLLLTLSVLTAFSAFAIEGVSIPNSHQVDREGKVFRGREPKKLITELADIGISDILIFKNSVKNEVSSEILDATKLKMKPHHIPFRWKGLESVQVACEQVIDALNIIFQVKENGGSIYFHCTAGEDRTGLLAGLYRMLDEGLSMKKVFKEEMCARGYSDGNPHKPGMVSGAIQKELTPLFIALAEKIEDGTLSGTKLSKRFCKTLQVQPTKMKCKN